MTRNAMENDLKGYKSLLLLSCYQVMQFVNVTTHPAASGGFSGGRG